MPQASSKTTTKANTKTVPSAVAEQGQGQVQSVRDAAWDQQMLMLRGRRQQLVDQIAQLNDMRNQLQAQRMHASERSGRELDSRMEAIDQRTGTLERQLFGVDDQINKLNEQRTGNVTTTTKVGGSGIGFGGGAGGQTGAIVMTQDDMARIRRDLRNEVEDSVFGAVMATATGFVFLVLAWRGVRRWIWKAKPAPAVTAHDHSTAIAQLQQSMDVIAVEVERISEAQRYVAKLLNERSIGAGEAQPVGSQREPEAIREKRF